jgi:hypothetical protein
MAGVAEGVKRIAPFLAREESSPALGEYSQRLGWRHSSMARTELCTMIKHLLFAAAGLAALAVAPASRADDQGDRVHLVGGCPAIADRPDCPGAPPPPPGGYPPAAQPGQCYAQVRTPPVFQSYSQQVMTAPGHREVRYAPAQYEWRERQVLIAPARTVRHVIPATWRQVTETVVVQPASVHVEQIPPVYETVTEQVVVRAAHTEWRRTFVGPGGVIPPGAELQPTGEVVCLVEVPAQYAMVQRQVMREPGRVVQTPIPAVTQQVTRQVIDQPEHVVFEQIPAQYGVQKYKVLVRPGHAERIDVPPAYETRTEQRMVSPGALEWRRVDCDTHGPPGPPPPGPPPPPPPPR